MSSFEIAAAIVCLTAALGFVNARFLRLPSAIGMMAMALLGSFAVFALQKFGFLRGLQFEAFAERIDFADVLMHGLLGFLLFAGALHVSVSRLAAFKWTIAALALVATLLSSAIVGGATWLLSNSLGLGLKLTEALLFGALISPTDPIAVLGILKSAKVPEQLSLQISGESLFNDGIAVVLFTALFAADQGGHLTVGSMALLFLREVVGGVLFGLALGYLGYRILRAIDDYSVEVLITLAIVFGGYVGAEHLQISAPLAAVVSGLVIGNQGRQFGMSERTRRNVDLFWNLVDEMLNAILFLLLGFQATQIQLSHSLLLSMAAAVPIALMARFVSVASVAPLLAPLSGNSVKVLTWGGLRGGISVALALSIPGPARNTILGLTYAVVTFSVLVQGLTLSAVLRRLGMCEQRSVTE